SKTHTNDARSRASFRPRPWGARPHPTTARRTSEMGTIRFHMPRLGIALAGALALATATASPAFVANTMSGSAFGERINVTVNAKVGGSSVAANPAPNTTLLNVGAIAKVVLNEQTSSTGAGANSITVNAVHVYLNAGALASGDIIISQSHCDVAGGNVVPVGT